MQYVFLVNQLARDGELKKLWQEAEPHIAQQLGSYETCYPRTAEETRALARQYADKRSYCVISVGGEGTMNMVMNGIMDSEGRDDTVMALVPFGNVNDYATTLGMEKNWQSAIEVIRQGNEKRVSVTELKTPGSRFFALNIADIGFGASTAKRHSVDHSLSWFKGNLKYKLLALLTLLSWRNIPSEVYVDDEKIEGEMALVLAGYSPTLGGFRILPHAELETDEFAVTICRNVSRLHLMSLIEDSRKSRLVEDGEQVIFRKARRIHVKPQGSFVTQVDGEITDLSAAWVEFISHPRAIRFMAPA